MVDALRECRRILTPEGILVDLRPYHNRPAIEVVTDDGIFIPGHVDDRGGMADDIAADKAMTEALRRGYFTPKESASFLFANYWDTLDGLLAYADERWNDYACIPPSVVVAARRAISAYEPAPADAGRYRMRIRRLVQLAVYGK